MARQATCARHEDDEPEKSFVPRGERLQPSNFGRRLPRVAHEVSSPVRGVHEPLLPPKSAPHLRKDYPAPVDVYQAFDDDRGRWSILRAGAATNSDVA